MSRRRFANWVERRLGRYFFPYQLSFLIDNPLRRCLVTPERLVGRIPVASGGRLLEVGPGSGFFSAALAEKVAHGRLDLIDVQPEMVRRARRRLRRGAVANTGFVVGDVERLPYKNHSFDCAVLVAVLGEVRRPELCVKELRRVLVSGGFLVIHEHLPDPDWLRPRYLRALIEKQSFSLVRKWGKPWNYAAVFQADVEVANDADQPTARSFLLS